MNLKIRVWELTRKLLLVLLKWRWREEGEDERKSGSFPPVKSGGGGG